MTFQIDANHAMARATSLVEAVKVAGEAEAEKVLEIAHKFYAYITHDSRPNVAPVAPVAPAPAPAPAPAKPVKAKATPAAPAAKAPEPKPELPVSDTTKEEVGEVVSKLLAAKLREEAIGLLKKFKATSVSGVIASDYEKFVSEGKKILGAAAVAAQGEVENVEADLEA